MTYDDRGADQLRTALAATAEHHRPDPEAWQHITDRLSGDGPVLVAVGGPRRPGHRRRTRILAAAAIIAAIAALGAMASLTRDVDPGTTDVATTPPADATGWYIPVGLADGWSVGAVTVQRMDEPCPCTATVWADPERDVIVTRLTEPDRTNRDGVTEVPGQGATTFDISEGIEATLSAPDDQLGYWDVDWVVGGERQVLTAIGVPPARAVELAREVYADPTSTWIDVGGVELIETWAEPSDVNREADVQFTMVSPDGHFVDVSLASSHRFIAMAGSLVPTDRLADDQPLPLQTLRSYDNPTGEVPRVRDYIGLWPGGSVRVLGGYSGEAATDAEIDAVAASLRPATLQEWRAFVSTAANRDRAATASATLDDLIEGRTSSTAATTTTVLSDPGRLEDLELSLAAEPQLATWEDAMAVLTVHNPTGAPIGDPGCALDGAGIALLPAGEATRDAVDAIPAGERWWTDGGPCDGGTVIEPGATKTIRLQVRAQFLDARYGPLPAGSYRATASIEGVEAQPSAPVEIGPDAPPCSGDAEAYVGRTEADARALAEQRGVAEVRVPEPGPDSDVVTHRCDRLTLVLGDGGRVTYARFY